MFHQYPSVSPYFVDPYASSPYYSHDPYSARLAAAQRQRQAQLHDQRRQAHAEAERRRMQRDAYERHLQRQQEEEEWQRRLHGRSPWNPVAPSRVSRRRMHEDSDEDFDQYHQYGYDSDEDERQQAIAEQQAQALQQQQRHQALRNGLHGDPRAHSRMNAVNGLPSSYGTASDPKSRESSVSGSKPVSIPIRPAYGEKEEQAASTLQKHFRAHHYRRQALASLSSLSDSLASRQSSLALPAQLDLDDKGRIAYDSNNAPFHAYEDFLVGLLSKVDEISTKGDEQIKKSRKQFVRLVEKELSRLDQMREQAIKEGSSSEDEEQEAITGAEDEAQTEQAQVEAFAPTDDSENDEQVEKNGGAKREVEEEEEVQHEEDEAVNDKAEENAVVAALLDE